MLLQQANSPTNCSIQTRATWLREHLVSTMKWTGKQTDTEKVVLPPSPRRLHWASLNLFLTLLTVSYSSHTDSMQTKPPTQEAWQCRDLTTTYSRCFRRTRRTTCLQPWEPPVFQTETLFLQLNRLTKPIVTKPIASVHARPPLAAVSSPWFSSCRCYQMPFITLRVEQSLSEEVKIIMHYKMALIS